MWLTRITSILHSSMLQSVQNAEPHLRMIGILGASCFPIFYFVWHDFYPQPYENLGLRFLGVAICAPWIFVMSWPDWMSRYKVLYWYITNAYIFPIFFGYMFLMNGGNVVWAMSMLVSMFLISLMLDVWNFVIVWFVGLAVAFVMYGESVGYVIPENVGAYMPVYLFAVISIGVMNYNTQLIKREKMRAMLGVANYLAHELRTPLLAIRSSSLGIGRYLPILLDNYEKAEKAGVDVTPIRSGKISTLRKALSDVETEVEYSSTIIDMLLMNTRKGKVSDSEFERFKISECVNEAVARYPFQSKEERNMVSLHIENDFSVNGTKLLLVHVFFNLMKNSLYAISEAGGGCVDIVVKTKDGGGMVLFNDTGAGIPKKILPHIFTAFYSSKNAGVGAGMGLSFCKDVTESMGGKIYVESEEGEYTSFIITFKAIEDD